MMLAVRMEVVAMITPPFYQQLKPMPPTRLMDYIHPLRILHVDGQLLEFIRRIGRQSREGGDCVP